MIGKLEHDIDGYDLCVIGAGPAGLMVAAELADAGLRICVIESGAERRSRFTEALKEVESDRLQIKEESRERLLGGASGVWGGGSSPLDDIDYEVRPWNRGWPFRSDELEPYMEAAAQRYCFPDPAEFSRLPPQFSGEQWQGWGLEGLCEKLFVIVRPIFHFASLRSMFDRNGMDLLLQATVTELVSEARGENRSVTEVLCRTPEAKAVRVRARSYVLAAGGIENPRLLLVSDLGNERDQVGRYFMNHPRGYAGVVKLRSPLPAVNPYLTRTVGGRWLYAGLALAPERRRADGLLSSYVRFEPVPLRSSVQRHAFGIGRRVPAGLAPLWTLLQPRRLRLRWYAEMEARAENRVTLSSRKDVFGTPLPLVSYSLGERDKQTLTALYAQLGSEIERLGLGRADGSAEAVVAAVCEDASHHMGGTRMGSDPSSSVVDATCRVHSVENLYVGGSSVFRVGGRSIRLTPSPRSPSGSVGI